MVIKWSADHKMPVALSANLASTHALTVDIALQDETVGEKINEFRSLDSISTCDKESSIYEECIDKIKCTNNRYKLIYRLKTRTQF